MSSIQNQAMLRRAKHAQRRPKLSAPIAPPSSAGSGKNQLSVGQYEGYDPVSDSHIVDGKLVKNLLTIDNIPTGEDVLMLEGGWGDY